MIHGDSKTDVAPYELSRRRTNVVPPDDVRYAAGAAIAARNTFSILLDDYAWYKSQLRNWMLARGLSTMTCQIAGQHIRARLVPQVITVCSCHHQDLIACASTLSAIERREPVAVESFVQQAMTIDVV